MKLVKENGKWYVDGEGVKISCSESAILESAILGDLRTEFGGIRNFTIIGPPIGPPIDRNIGSIRVSNASKDPGVFFPVRLTLLGVGIYGARTGFEGFEADDKDKLTKGDILTADEARGVAKALCDAADWAEGITRGAE